MGIWSQQAREEAARHWGRRYYRWYATGHILRILAPVLLPAAAITTAAAGVWALSRYLSWAGAMRVAAAVLTISLLIWFTAQTITGAGIRARAAGRRQPLPALAIASILLLLAGSLLIR